MNVSINILFLANPRHNMPQLLGRKFIRQFFHLPLTGLATQTSPLSDFSKTKGKKTVLVGIPNRKIKVLNFFCFKCDS